VRAVLEVLVGGVGVDGGHQALDDAELVVERLGHRRQAVRRARRVGDDVVVVGVVVGVVDAHHDGDVLVLRRGGDDHLLGAGLEVGLGLGGVGEEAGGLDHHVGAEVLPRQRGRVALLERGERLAADRDGVSGGSDLAGQPAQDRVVLQQVGQGLVVGEVVDPDDLDVGA
jgi:hypothetical protein